MLGKCRVCGGECKEFGRLRIMGKFDGVYESCPACGYLQARDPFWLEESYQDPITKTDIGSVNRCMANSVFTQLILGLFLRSSGPFLDYGAGYGMFVRYMRDQGYDFWYYDSYCQNIFAEGFEVAPESSRRFEMLTCYEVFEHLVDPMAELSKMLRHGDNVLFTTELLPQPIPPMGQWWYHSPEHGQHVGFFSKTTFAHIAEKLGMHFATNGTNLHYLGKRRLSSRALRLVSHRRAGLLVRFCRRPSLLLVDFTARRKMTFANQGQTGAPPPLVTR